jgi:hypothetical protein
MCFLSIFPFAGLMIIVLLISFKVVLLQRKGISVKAGTSKKPAANRFLYPVFLLILLLWLTALSRARRLTFLRYYFLLHSQNQQFIRLFFNLQVHYLSSCRLCSCSLPLSILKHRCGLV